MQHISLAAIVITWPMAIAGGGFYISCCCASCQSCWTSIKPATMTPSYAQTHFICLQAIASFQAYLAPLRHDLVARLKWLLVPFLCRPDFISNQSLLICCKCLSIVTAAEMLPTTLQGQNCLDGLLCGFHTMFNSLLHCRLHS